MEQKLLMRLIEQIYILNSMQGKNRAVLKLTGKQIFIAMYQNFHDDLDLSSTCNIRLGRYNTINQLKEAYAEILYYISDNSQSK